jgi:hypothetical protein
MDVLNIFALSFAIFFILIFFYVNLRRKDLSIKKTIYSEYALGGNGKLVRLSLVLIGLNQLILAINLINQADTISAIFISLAGVGAIMTGAFCMTKRFTIGLHEIGVALQLLCFPLSLLTLKTTNYHSAIFGITTLILTIVIFINFIIKSKAQAGLIQKTNILIINLWLLITPITYLLTA